MTARMVLRLSVIVQYLVIQFGLRLVACEHFGAAGRGDAAPSGDRPAWWRSRGAAPPAGRLAHNHCAVASIRHPAASPIREAGGGPGCVRSRYRLSWSR